MLLFLPLFDYRNYISGIRHRIRTLFLLRLEEDAINIAAVARNLGILPKTGVKPVRVGIAGCSRLRANKVTTNTGYPPGYPLGIRIWTQRKNQLGFRKRKRTCEWQLLTNQNIHFGPRKTYFSPIGSKWSAFKRKHTSRNLIPYLSIRNNTPGPICYIPY